MTDIKERYAKEAAFINLRAVLDEKTPGDRITALEIREATGFQEWQSFRQRIIRYCKSRGLYLQAVPNDGYRVLPSREHADYADKRRRQAGRREIDGLRACNDARLQDLTEEEIRRLNWVKERQQVRVEHHIRHATESQKEFATRERIPLLRSKPPEDPDSAG